MGERDPDIVRQAALAEAEFQFSGALAAELRSPLYEALARHIADTPGHVAMLASARQTNVRLLLGAVHLLLLRGAEHELIEFYPTVGGIRAPDEGLPPAFDDFVSERRDEIERVMAERGVQTNEVRRSATLVCAFAAASRIAGRPLGLVELGCSAGLNLLFDRYAYSFSNGVRAGDPESRLTLTSEVRGGSTPPTDGYEVASRLGVDRDPVDVRDVEATEWIRACIWGDHPHRLAELEAAVDIARTEPPELMRGDMVEALPQAVGLVPEEAVPLVFHTNAVNYLPFERREALVERIAELGRQRPMLWLSGEGPMVVPGLPSLEDAIRSFAVVLALSEVSESVRSHVLGIAGAQGAWIDWRQPS